MNAMFVYFYHPSSLMRPSTHHTTPFYPDPQIPITILLPTQISCVKQVTISNIFSPHTGKVFIGACCATALYCYIALNDWRSNRQKLVDRLHKAEMERTAANCSGVPGSYAKAKVLSTEIDSLRSQLSLT
jgi:hypothetical protein